MFSQGFHVVRRSDRYWAGLWTDIPIEQSLMRAAKSRGGLTRGRGTSESVRLLWIVSGYKSAEVHDAKTELTNSKLEASDQHVEMRESRKLRDFEDLKRLIQWLLTHNPFFPIDPDLRCLHSGLSSKEGKDKVNCENIEIIGGNIQRNIDGQNFKEITFKKSNCIVTLTSLLQGIRCGEETVHINLSICKTSSHCRKIARGWTMFSVWTHPRTYFIIQRRNNAKIQ